jgi:hypothetical protein
MSVLLSLGFPRLLVGPAAPRAPCEPCVARRQEAGAYLTLVRASTAQRDTPCS